MIIIDQNTEESLMKEVYESQIQGYITRCLFLKLSVIHDLKAHIISTFIEACKTYFAEENGLIFVCENNDLIVFTDKAPRKKIAQFLSHVSQTLSSDSPIPTGGLATIFETGVNWNALVKICKEKLQIIKDRERMLALQNAKAIEAQKRQKLLDMELNPALVATLDKRRLSNESVRIMVIEDDVFTQTLLKKTLPQDYDVTMTGDGYGALTLYAKTAPDMVFLDIGLPDLTGHDILQKILQIDPHAFIVMLSGNGDQANIIRAIKSGAKGFIGKPFTRDKVYEYLHRSTHIKYKELKHG